VVWKNYLMGRFTFDAITSVPATTVKSAPGPTGLMSGTPLHDKAPGAPPKGLTALFRAQIELLLDAGCDGDDPVSGFSRRYLLLFRLLHGPCLRCPSPPTQFWRSKRAPSTREARVF
jgi:hypothetical protein